MERTNISQNDYNDGMDRKKEPSNERSSIYIVYSIER